MMVYKISGKTTEESIIYIIQDEEYKGKRRVSPGKYDMIFESNSDGPIIVVAESTDGRIMSFGQITPIEAVGQVPNLNKLDKQVEFRHESLSYVIYNLSSILDDLKKYYKISQEILDDMDDTINILKTM